MKLEATTVTMIRISELRNLDPIRVSLDNIEPGKGRITIECYGEAWSSWWGAMSGLSVEEFFVGCDNDYLIQNLANHTPESVFDGEQFTQRCQKRICILRKNRELSAKKARSLFNEAEELSFCESIDGLFNAADKDFIRDIYGEEWWYGVDEDGRATHPKRRYLSRIIDAVKPALRQYIESQCVAA